MNQKRAIRQLKEIEKYTKEANKEMRLAAEDWNEEWQTLIAIIMSAQSRDETTIPIAENLFERYNTLEKLAKASYRDVLRIFKSLNYNRTKAKNVINAAQFILKEFKGKIPHSIEELLKIPGVGRKTANVFLSENGHDALGIDTHCSFISQKLGWTKHKNPHKIEDDLKKLFPRKYWIRVNPTLVRFGKTFTSRKKKDELLMRIRGIK